jgi:hypothetical protein
MGGSIHKSPITASAGETTLVRTLAPETGRLIESVTRGDTATLLRRTLIEVGVVYSILVLLEASLFDGSIGSFGVHPHPYWLVILTAAAARGLVPGLFAAAIGTCLYSVGVLVAPEVAGSMSLLEVLTMREPILFFAVAYVVGELRDGTQSRLRKLGTGWLDVEASVERLLHERDVLAATNRELERRIVEHPGQVANLLHTATRLEQTRPEHVFDIALELVEEFCGARASVIAVAPDGHLTVAAPSDLSGQEESRLLESVRESELCERAIRLVVCVDGLRDGAPGTGPLCVAPLLDGQGFLLALLCLDDIPATHLNETTARIFSGVGEWVSASLSRMDRGALPLSREAVFTLAAPIDRTLGAPADLGARLRIETERHVRHNVPFTVIGIRSRSSDAERLASSMLALFGPELRSTDGIYSFGYPGCFVICLAGTSFEAGEAPLKRMRETAEHAEAAEQVGPLEFFLEAPEDDARDATELVASLASQLDPAPKHDELAPCPTQLRQHIGDMAACERRLDLETRLAQRLATELTVVEVKSEGCGHLITPERIEPELDTLLRRADGAYALNDEHMLIVLPATGGTEAKVISRRFEDFLCNDFGAPRGNVRTHVRCIEPGPATVSRSYEDEETGTDRLAVA